MLQHSKMIEIWTPPDIQSSLSFSPRRAARVPVPRGSVGPRTTSAKIVEARRSGTSVVLAHESKTAVDDGRRRHEMLAGGLATAPGAIFSALVEDHRCLRDTNTRDVGGRLIRVTAINATRAYTRS